MLHLGAGGAQRLKMCFELSDGRRMSIGRRGPPFENRRPELGQRRKTFFQGSAVDGGCTAEVLDLLLQTREALLKFASVCLHLHLVRAWYTNPPGEPTA